MLEYDTKSLECEGSIKKKTSRVAVPKIAEPCLYLLLETTQLLPL